MNSPAPKGQFYKLLPEPSETPLARLWRNAALAQTKVERGYRDRFDEYQMDRLENERQDAEQALRDHLLNEHGLTSADIKRWPL